MANETNLTGGAGFSFADTRALVKDLFTPNPRIYWADFGFHLVLGWAAFWLTLRLPFASPWQALSFVVSALALYRAVIFIHELAHLKKGSFTAFRVVWNLFCGFPLFVPSFSYTGVHLNHHRRDEYGTEGDGEYLPFVTRGRAEIVRYVLLHLLAPFLFVARSLILTPLSFFSPTVRRFAWTYLSSLAIDMTYQRPEPAKDDRFWYRVQEVAAFGYGVTFLVFFATGVFSYQVAVLWYLMAVTVFFLNALRTLAAHCYRNPGNRKMTLVEQYLDSVDIPGHPLFTALWAPVGLRYHATHHLFPNMPYHNLGKARRRLEERLPADSVYRDAVVPSLGQALSRIWQEAGETSRQRRQVTAFS